MEEKIVAQNKKAHHEYFIIDEIECGISLVGTEIKSIRQSRVSINEAYCMIKNHEVFVTGMHIAKYEQGNIFNHDPDRDKKLLLHKREIYRLENKTMLDGFTLIPLKVYIKDGICKVKIGVCKGKKLFDKRDSLKEKTASRESSKELKNY